MATLNCTYAADKREYSSVRINIRKPGYGNASYHKRRFYRNLKDYLSICALSLGCVYD